LAEARWRKWTPPLLVEEVFDDQAVWLPGGRLVAAPRFTWPTEVIERFRAGYKCVRCLEPQEQAWPERCSLCGYPMRTEQASFFAREFGGEKTVRAGRNWKEELDGLDERRRKEEERARKDDQLR
jgi:hypothetical protein